MESRWWRWTYPGQAEVRSATSESWGVVTSAVAPQGDSLRSRLMRTQVVIIGAGPAGLLLSHLLGSDGVESVLVERQSAEHVRSRIRAGILESATVELLKQAGVGDRLAQQG